MRLIMEIMLGILHIKYPPVISTLNVENYVFIM